MHEAGAANTGDLRRTFLETSNRSLPSGRAEAQRMQAPVTKSMLVHDLPPGKMVQLDPHP